MIKILVGILVLLVTTSPGTPQEVTIIQTSNATPYNEAVQALLKGLNHYKYTSRVIDLHSIEPGAIIQKREPRANEIFVGVGTKAAIFLGENLPSNVTSSYCMISGSQQLISQNKIRGYGISTDIPISSQFNLIREALPQVRSIGLLYRSDNTKSHHKVRSVSKKLLQHWELTAIPVDHYDSIAKAIKALCKEDVDIIWTDSDPSVYNSSVIHSLLLTSLRSNIPVFGFSVPFVKAGALMGIGINPKVQGTQAASLVSDLFAQKSGSDGAAKPVESGTLETKFDIAVNFVVAEKLTINFPEKILNKATHTFGSRDKR